MAVGPNWLSAGGSGNVLHAVIACKTLRSPGGAKKVQYTSLVKLPWIVECA